MPVLKERRKGVSARLFQLVKGDWEVNLNFSSIISFLGHSNGSEVMSSVRLGVGSTSTEFSKFRDSMKEIKLE